LSRRKTIKGGSSLRLQATLLFSQEVNSTFEAAVEGLYWVSTKLLDKRHLKGNGPSTSVHGAVHWRQQGVAPTEALMNWNSDLPGIGQSQDGWQTGLRPEISWFAESTG
jgi:hypothetical protein